MVFACHQSSNSHSIPLALFANVYSIVVCREYGTVWQQTKLEIDYKNLRTSAIWCAMLCRTVNCYSRTERNCVVVFTGAQICILCSADVHKTAYKHYDLRISVKKLVEYFWWQLQMCNTFGWKLQIEYMNFTKLQLVIENRYKTVKRYCWVMIYLIKLDWITIDAGLNTRCGCYQC